MRKMLPLVFLVVLLSGCSAFRAIIPGGVTAADAEWSGVKSGQPVSVVGSLDPRAASIAAVLSALGQGDPLGVLLPVSLVGETSPRWVLCDQALVAKCNAIPLNAKIHFAGRALGPGILWKPTRLTAENFND